MATVIYLLLPYSDRCTAVGWVFLWASTCFRKTGSGVRSIVCIVSVGSTRFSSQEAVAHT